MCLDYRKRGKIQKEDSSSSSSSSSSSRESVTGNLDLMNEIFIRMSFKSSIRCMVVCKDWYDLIKTMYNNNNNNNTLLTSSSRCQRQLSGLFFHIPSLPVGRFQYIPLFEEDDSAYTVFVNLSNPHYSNFEYSRILQSCNGILLLFNSFPLSRYFVFNSITRVHSILPKLSKDYVLSISLGFDGSCFCHYKVIALVKLSTGSCQIQVYLPPSSDSGIWRTVVSDCGIVINRYVKFLDGFFWNDSIIFVSCNSNLPTLSFNLSTEKLIKMASPPIHPGPYNLDKDDNIYLKESRGHLYFIECHFYLNFNEFNVYELEKKQQQLQWFFKYRIDFSDFCGGILRNTTAIRSITEIWWSDYENFPLVLSLINGDDEENSALLLYTTGQIVSYKLKDKTCKKLCDFKIDSDQLKYFRYWGHRCLFHHVMPVHFIHSSCS